MSEINDQLKTFMTVANTLRKMQGQTADIRKSAKTGNHVEGIQRLFYEINAYSAMKHAKQGQVKTDLEQIFARHLAALLEELESELDTLVKEYIEPREQALKMMSKLD